MPYMEAKVTEDSKWVNGHVSNVRDVTPGGPERNTRDLSTLEQGQVCTGDFF